MSDVRCRCRCHLYALGDRANAPDLAPHVVWALAQAVKEWDGVDTRDPLEAAVACPDCLARHSPALLQTRAWAPLVTPPPEPQPPYQASPDATGGDGEE